ncbi:putative alpha-ketoglutarate-dependent dioxygenase alkb [Botrytis fragariae]|uniref:Putative alpha-ketoglutarate-dependent dioxygenase alkb n=1 Tax=Botrytis fragariae TaxID=1964551 RepID=A0A8H6AZ01_9HELO|nr:putative alpha-ketoglutarate-dependent dioxygenase alkb [Botrytis fragariae]KAF5876154.1 putative alpha-ketoglutarate-dependent dioxygenase alkb [Botrytis fragariae]
MSTAKRTIDSFFKPPAKKPRVSELATTEEAKSAGEALEREFTRHPTYPFPIPCLPSSISSELSSFPSTIGKEINDQADLDLLYFEPYIPKYLERQLFHFLRSELPFYRVEYDIRRGGISTHIKTPRWTTVFGLDETSKFNNNGELIDANSGKKIEKERCYTKYPPRPIPKCLDNLRLSTELATGCKFNFCLVNYYASGSDSISYQYVNSRQVSLSFTPNSVLCFQGPLFLFSRYIFSISNATSVFIFLQDPSLIGHADFPTFNSSDDERFLGSLPAIASYSLGARRDFLMKHKPIPPNDNAPPPPETKPIKLPLASGDMILMRGRTQANWLHSIPKRTGKNADDGGRINITFRRAMVKGGTENYYNYNVGTGPVYKWDDILKEMRIWKEL